MKHHKNYRSTCMSMIRSGLYATTVKALHTGGLHRLHIQCLTETGAVKDLKYNFTMLVEFRVSDKYTLYHVSDGVTILPDKMSSNGKDYNTYTIRFGEFIEDVSDEIVINTKFHEIPIECKEIKSSKKFYALKVGDVSEEPKKYSLMDVISPTALLYEMHGDLKKDVCEIRMDI